MNEATPASAIARGGKRRIPWWARLALIAASLFFMLRWFEHAQVYFPTTRLAAEGDELGRPLENVLFKSGDGVLLHAWFYPAATNSPRHHLAMLICHGNGGNISHRLELYSALLAAGVNVLAFDYRGYGMSGGRPGEAGTYLDAQAAYQWLRQRGFGPKQILAFGESLGGGVVAELAVREPVGGIVLQSTFTSIPDIGAEIFPWLPVRWMATIQYDTRVKLPRLNLPVLVMHSRADSLVPFHHAERNFAAAREPKLFWELAGDHNDSLAAGRTRFVEGVEKFLVMVEGRAEGKSVTAGSNPTERPP